MQNSMQVNVFAHHIIWKTKLWSIEGRRLQRENFTGQSKMMKGRQSRLQTSHVFSEQLRSFYEKFWTAKCDSRQCQVRKNRLTMMHSSDTEQKILQLLDIVETPIDWLFSWHSHLLAWIHCNKDHRVYIYLLSVTFDFHDKFLDRISV